MANKRINQGLSLVIPRIFPQWIDEATIIRIFDKQHIGRIGKVSIVRKPDEPGRNYPVYKAYLYFSVWYENEIAYNFQQRIYGPKKQARVVYDDPWYWVVFENTNSKLSFTDQRILRMDARMYHTECRINQLEDQQQEEQQPQPHPQHQQPQPHPQPQRPPMENPFILTQEFAMRTLGDELELTETAFRAADMVLWNE
jgi:hypothetical protein